ncbi:DCC1-like thiol-disulfide oxidoreductase family protein [Rheinheimera sediminis]|uniref:DCC1-like thiol-disulfide oxidoreductase family protein n=1 Tax=Rheinheimera sp. YQF-1 TaxID=2499626 RepID=UPI001647E237|nr:DCC1-like thiol-disulfide oxidoreductase family protein [Rheinheimera sp. YQF-1]
MQLALIYDGDCPLCRHYVAAQRLQKQFGELTLLNARDLPEQAPLLLAELHALGLVINQSMLLRVDGRWLKGAEVLQLLASLNEASWRNRLWLYWFQSADRARFSYPLLRAGRNLLLKLLKIPPLPY